MFQVEVMAIYRTAQWILTNSISLTCLSVFSDKVPVLSDNQTAIRFLSGFVDNCRIFRKCRRCLWPLHQRFTVVSPRTLIPVNCRTDELARAFALLPESSSTELGMPLALVKLDIERKFFRDSNLSWVNISSAPLQVSPGP